MMDRIIEKQKNLMRRIEKNFSDYKSSVLKLDKQSIFDKAAEIAAMKQVVHYMTNIHGYYERDIDYLLKFQNPLELVADHYKFNLQAELNDVIARICDTQDHTSDYPLMPEAKAKESER
ncbi:hypothetical protein [Dehalobacterium formicoaceticum]|uniref:hypothetical protein n=1 Tax=Dehalobacterium formicoaceticum TaxID=51515 RepID=UPI0031F5F667